MQATDYQLSSWVEIDLPSLRHNLQAVRAALSPETEIMAVVKANAYGQGAAGVAWEFYRQGVRTFAVSWIAEAEALRRAGIQEEILVFFPPLTPEELNWAVDLDLTITLADQAGWEHLQSQAAALNRPLRVEIKVDSGLHRFGFTTATEIAALCGQIQAYPALQITGIYTHMADPSDASATRRQFSQFTQILQTLERQGLTFPRRHCAGSATWLLYPEMELDVVRLGTVLSGQLPVTAPQRHLSLQDPYTYKSRVLAIRDLPAGTPVGYAGSYRLRKPARLAVVPVGYHEGLAAEVGNPVASWTDLLKRLLKTIMLYKGMRRVVLHAQINGQRYPIRGKVFMQTALVELPLDFPVQIGQEVSLPIRKTMTKDDIWRLFVDAGEVEAYIDNAGNYCPVSKE